VVGVSLTTDTYAQGRVVNILTGCPACGYEFSPNERRYKHLDEHEPEDFGLDPLGVVDAARQDRVSETWARFQAFCDRYGVDFRRRGEDSTLDLGRLDPNDDPDPEYLVRQAYKLWDDAKQDLARFRAATVTYRRPHGAGSNAPAFRYL
jgi:hypothetical protein